MGNIPKLIAMNSQNADDIKNFYPHLQIHIFYNGVKQKYSLRFYFSVTLALSHLHFIWEMEINLKEKSLQKNLQNEMKTTPFH